jgi:predicted transcriptional regulator
MKIADAITLFITQEALAEQLGLKQPSIARWVSKGVIPPLRQLQLEVVTGGLLKADKSILPSKKRNRKFAVAHSHTPINTNTLIV